MNAVKDTNPQLVYVARQCYGGSNMSKDVWAAEGVGGKIGRGKMRGERRRNWSEKRK